MARASSHADWAHPQEHVERFKSKASRALIIFYSTHHHGRSPQLSQWLESSQSPVSPTNPVSAEVDQADQPNPPWSNRIEGPIV